MPISGEMRKLENRWNTRGLGSGWPKFLEYLEIGGLRGWHGQKVDFTFPIVAIVGENGSGKSTILQCAASIYKSPSEKLSENRFASDYFPETVWDKLKDISIRYSYKEGQASLMKSIRKPTDRWRGNPDRPIRKVEYVDLSRIQPISARMGYRKLADPSLKETEANTFEKGTLDSFSAIIGQKYESVRMALTNADTHKKIPVMGQEQSIYSGFHQGAGEITVAELIQVGFQQYSLLLIDEIETSLHPRAQRRLIRYLAEKCRQLDLQIILTTHSPYILDELPLEGRLYIIDEDEKIVVRGVSPEFAMTKMDEQAYTECDIYVEDNRSAALLKEILIKHSNESVHRCQFISYGSAQVGCSLGQMVYKNLFPRPSCVFLDGDQETAVGCHVLPGGDAPERIVFNGLEAHNWVGIDQRIGRSFSEIADSCKKAITYTNHKEWCRMVADDLLVSTDSFWEALCYCWVKHVLKPDEVEDTIRAVEDCLIKETSTPLPRPGRLF